jgi:hypothetical protein
MRGICHSTFSEDRLVLDFCGQLAEGGILQQLKHFLGIYLEKICAGYSADVSLTIMCSC